MKERVEKKISKKFLAIATLVVLVMSIGLTAYAASKKVSMPFNSSKIYGTAYNDETKGKFTAWTSACANADSSFKTTIHSTYWDARVNTVLIVNGSVKKTDSVSTGNMTSSVSSKLLYAGSMSGLSYAKAKTNGANFYVNVDSDDTLVSAHYGQHRYYIRGAYIVQASASMNVQN